MFVEIPQQEILMILGAFLLGWILSSINSRLADRQRAKKRDPRDDRIRSLEAEQRVANSDAESLRDTVVKLKSELEEVADGVEKRDNVITHQQERMEELKKDLKESVLKTRELRHELSDRAAESVHAEAKQRELETELSVAQASSDMIATGVLDYSLAPGNDESENDEKAASESDEAGVSKAAT
ncbi:MAG: hypothetical protein QNI99_15215 [Woeseiaceae bacterium]|nr:hypothetical protein [Woeseiaceae bacterium]